VGHNLARRLDALDRVPRRSSPFRNERTVDEVLHREPVASLDVDAGQVVEAVERQDRSRPSACGRWSGCSPSISSIHSAGSPFQGRNDLGRRVRRLRRDRKAGVAARLGRRAEHELPDEGVERRPQVAGHVADDEREILERRLGMNASAQRVPAAPGVELDVDP
jgi:hypothetical protein